MKRLLIVIAVSLLLIAGCNRTPAGSTPSQSPTSDVPPTSTPLPMALVVNGEGITVDEYNAALKRLQDAQQSIGQSASAQEQHDALVDQFVGELLLVQAAVQAGKTVDDAELQARIDALAADIGGAEKLAEWQQKYGYTPEAFNASLRRSILVSWQRDAIINAVPTTADQVHARQILLLDEDNAAYAYAQLQTGTNFETLAYEYDPALGGELSWFPQWGLTQQNVADAAFALQPGEHTQVIKSEIGYHIVYVIERDANHPLSVNMRRILQERTLQEWLASAKAASSIQILVN
jgi:parvulin-like peptidyl-prolyl isomerase